MTRFTFFSAVGVVCALLLAGCAGQQPPEGGPADTEAPEIVSVYPAPNAVGFRDNRVAFEFSEYVDRRSVEDAVFISPFVSDVEYQWSGRELELLFPSALRGNTTYVITIGTDVKDVHNGNRMADAYTLAFSTGAVIDRGTIAGRVVDAKPEGVMVFAYRLDSLDADTLNPSTLKPDYINQTGRGGTYALSHLAWGTYRLFAVRDEYRDLLYNPEVDAAGTLTRDIVLTAADTLRDGCNFTIALEDTSAPRLLTADARTARTLVLTFNEQLDTTRIAPGRFSIVDTLTLRALGVTHVFLPDPARSLSVALRTAVQEKDAGYRVHVDGVFDLAAHPVSALARSVSFRGSGTPDTAAPRLVVSTVRDTSVRVRIDDTFRFDFSDALSPAINGALTFRLGDSVSVPFTLRRTSSAGVMLQPVKPLEIRSRYALRLRMDSVISLSGRGWKDSVTVFRYGTVDPDNFGSIDGVVTADAFADTSSVVAEAVNTTGKQEKSVRTVMRKDRTFSFPMLDEGMYALRVFSDHNRNGALDAGRVYPYRASEPFLIGRDTIKVRARWPVEGAILR